MLTTTLDRPRHGKLRAEEKIILRCLWQPRYEGGMLHANKRQ